MKTINNFIIEKLHLDSETNINKDKKGMTFNDICPTVDFENPKDEDAKELEAILKKEGVFPTATKLDSKYTTFNKWFIEVNSWGGLSLKYNATFSKPYKKKQNYNSRMIDFDIDSFIATSSGGSVIYKNECPETWDKVIIPIADFFGAKFNKDGEFLMPGAKSKWSK